MTYYIINEFVEIIDESDSLVSLRLICDDMNEFFGDGCKIVTEEEYEVLFNEIVIGG